MNKVVLVTGSAKNLGSVIVEEFASHGYDVVINYKTSKQQAEQLKEKVESLYNVKVLTIKCDISNEQEVIDMTNQIIDTFGHVDVLVNNAAIEICSSLLDKNYDSFSKVLNTNVIGTFLVSKYVGLEMKKQKSGKIINISSNNGIDKYDSSTLEYDASKSAVINMTYNLAKEFAPYVNVNAVAPGWILTDDILKLDKELDSKFIESESKKILLKRFALSSEIAKVITFLASDDASYINGTVIKVDGGY